MAVLFTLKDPKKSGERFRLVFHWQNARSDFKNALNLFLLGLVGLVLGALDPFYSPDGSLVPYPDC
jgi:hypothetical protein